MSAGSSSQRTKKPRSVSSSELTVAGSCNWLATGVTGPCIVRFPLKSTSSSQ